jgi:hypothetical protein
MIFIADRKTFPSQAKSTPLALGYYMLSVHRLASFLNQRRVSEILVEDEMLRTAQARWMSPNFLAPELGLVADWLAKRPEMAEPFRSRAESFAAAEYVPSSPASEQRILLRMAAGRKIDATINGVEKWLEVPQLLGETIMDVACPGLPDGKLRLGWPQKVTYGTMPSRDQMVEVALANETLVGRVERLIYPALGNEGDEFVCQESDDRLFGEMRAWEESNKIPAVLNGVILPVEQLPEGVEMRPGVDATSLRWQWLSQAGLAPYWTSAAKNLLGSCADTLQKSVTDRALLAAAAGRFYWPAVIG